MTFTVMVKNLCSYFDTYFQRSFERIYYEYIFLYFAVALKLINLLSPPRMQWSFLNHLCSINSLKFSYWRQYQYIVLSGSKSYFSTKKKEPLRTFSSSSLRVAIWCFKKANSAKFGFFSSFNPFWSLLVLFKASLFRII